MILRFSEAVIIALPTKLFCFRMLLLATPLTKREKSGVLQGRFPVAGKNYFPRS